MLYVKISAELAAKLKLTDIRTGDERHGFVVSVSDLAVYGLGFALDEGAKLMTNKEAKSWVYNFKNNRL